MDARQLPRWVLEEKCRQAHRLRKRGMTRAEIGEIVGVKSQFCCKFFSAGSALYWFQWSMLTTFSTSWLASRRASHHS